MYHTGSQNLRKVLQGGGIFRQWCLEDILENLGPLMAAAGYSIDERGLIVRKSGLGWSTPWIHVKRSPGKRCNLDHHIIYNHFHFIPKRCHECWKIVVSPRTLKELFALEALERELDFPSKCGIEVRSYTPRLYGGYFYCDSIDHGRRRFEVVREAVSDAISPDVPVVLKRACTEYELETGPSPYWVITPENEAMERRIEERVDLGMHLDNNQPDYVVAHVKKRWVEWAYSSGDPTYAEYTDGQPIYPDTVKYHEGALEDVRADLARARSSVLYSAAPGDVDALLTDIGAMMEKHKINPAVVATALGHTDFNPLFMGGHDETT